MLTLPLDRQRRETVLMSVIGLLAVGSIRLPLESTLMLAGEALAVACTFVALGVSRAKDRKNVSGFLSGLLLLIPLIASFAARKLASPVAFEMTALTWFGVAALTLSLTESRTRAMSLVASGFLTLFATFVSDRNHAIAIAMIWMTLCVWHLVANHWERVELHSAENVRPVRGLRPLTVALAAGLLVLGMFAARGRFSDSTRFDDGFMPVSGGSSWSDSAAISGIGTGDAAIAGIDKAESFGAVDSDLFLESTESTLFDMFSDSIGQPKLKNKWERRQGLSSENVLEAHSRTAKSEKGGSSFSTDRLPPERHLHLDDARSQAIIQWAGASGIRLAMNRYDAFDGVEWTNQANRKNERLDRVKFGEQIWFFDPLTRVEACRPERDRVDVGALKVIGLDSNRIPVPMMTSGLHIKEIDRQDFYAMDDDGSFIMPGRDKIPSLTVIHVASLKISEDELIAKTREPQADSRSSRLHHLDEISALVRDWTEGCGSRYEKLRTIVRRLRSEFEFDRSADLGDGHPVREFLSAKRGGDHLFATTAALMAEEIGCQARFVSGFYVRPSALDLAADHSNVLRDDVHTWVEIDLGDGRWFEIEPTPGFREPVYRPSLWLTTKRFAAAHWGTAVALVLFGVAAYAVRLVWIEWLLRLVWLVSFPARPRARMGLAMWIIEFRATLLKHSRPPESPQRDWLLEDLLPPGTLETSLRNRIEAFCDLADQLCFGSSEARLRKEQQETIAALVGALPIRLLKRQLSESVR